MEDRVVITCDSTNYIARKCLFCGNIDIYPTGFADGRKCSKCDGHSAIIGYAKEVKNMTDIVYRLLWQLQGAMVCFWGWSL